MSRRRIEPAPALGLVVMAALTGLRAGAGQWPTAAVDAAALLIFLYVLLRPLRRSKGTRMTLLSKEAIFGADDRRYEDVAVPEWGGTVRLRSLTGEERDRYEASMVKRVGGKQVEDLRNARARLVVLAAVDETGAPLFDANDAAALGRRNAGALDRLFEAACRLSGISDGDVKELEENFGEGQSEPPTSDSPSASAAPSPSSSPASPPANSPSGWPLNGSTAPSAQPEPTR
ncbi:hypothetical protein GCM10023196_035520 [Actinoallomurus vinaceus]|uniref:Uncharacterized protein n=1 Tax=Actinoallomurus vinaceus TaxID=1080074 RepID=A0ABP8U8T7_9ACTN